MDFLTRAVISLTSFIGREVSYILLNSGKEEVLFVGVGSTNEGRCDDRFHRHMVISTHYKLPWQHRIGKKGLSIQI